MNIRALVLALLTASTMMACQKNANPPVDFIVQPLKTKQDVKLSTEYANKPVVVYLWATWCGPCKQFAPTLNKFADEYKPKGVEFLAISTEDAKVVEQSEAREPHRMTILLDPYSSAAEALNGTALPTLVVLDKEHRPVWGTQGIGATTSTDFKTALDSVL